MRRNMYWFSRRRRLVTNHESQTTNRLSDASTNPSSCCQSIQSHNNKQYTHMYQNAYKENYSLKKLILHRFKCYLLTLKNSRNQVKACLNQIVEVLLALFLANLLLWMIMQTPSTASAYDIHLLEDEAPSIFTDFRRMDRSFRPAFKTNLPSYNDNTDLDDITDDTPNQLQRSQNFKISPKPCSFGRIEGTCMFVWECIKSEGRHVGMCVDSFMFGSCCTHNFTDNIVLSQTFSYTRPTKPVGIANVNHRPRPPHQPHKPAISGMTTIERPHGAGTLVIRPSGPHHQGALSRPHHTRPTISPQKPFVTNSVFSSSPSSSSPPSSSSSLSNLPTLGNLPHSSLNEVLSDSVSLSSTSLDNLWQMQTAQMQHTTLSSIQEQQQQHHWHFSTEANFITKPRPPIWDKPYTVKPKPKPTKPTKKPIITLTGDSQIFNAQNHHHHHHQQQQHQQQQQNHHHHHQQEEELNQHQTPSGLNVYSTSTNKPTSQLTAKPSEQDLITHSYIKKNATSPTKPFHSDKPMNDSITTPSFIQMQPTKYTTQKYRPTTSSLTSTTTTPISSSKPSSISTFIMTTTKSPPSSSYPTTSKPLLSNTTSFVVIGSNAPSNPSTVGASFSSTTSRPSQTFESQSIIESNEITDTNLSGTTIKTISAARSECGVPVLARPETRIVGGKSAAFGRWPWQVSVRRTSFFGFSSTHRCGGALINENWIATAGHCVDDLLISQIRIRVGEYDFSHVQEQLPYIERAVSKKVVHPKYNFFTYEYDLALVKLEQPLEFAPHVSPICLPQTDSLLIGMNATVTGWGRLSEGGTLPSVLQEVSVPIVSNDNCKNMFLRAGRQEFIPEIFLCAGYEGGGQDSCQGDSGGPLQVKSQDGRYFLAGIISWGIGCAEANLPGVCTRISKFVPWILENVT